MRRIVKLLFSILLSIILSVTIYYGLTNDKDFINIYGFSTLIISSGSMEPELKIGDVIIIKRLDDYEVNDIVTYIDKENYLITHRIMEKNGTSFTMKGDNNNVQDSEKVSINDIKGKMIINSKLLKLIYTNWLLVFISIILVFIFL